MAPNTVGASDLAVFFGVSTEIIRRWRGKGMPCVVISGRPRYDVAKAVQWRREEDRREQLERATKAPPKESDERARKLSWDASIAELKYRERIGELVPAADVERQHERLCLAVRSRVLALRGRWAPRAIGLASMADAAQLFDALAADILAGLTEAADELEADAESEGVA